VIRHVVCLTWKEGTPRSAIDAARLEVLALPDKIPEIRRLSVGHDLGFADDNADLAIVADFDDAAAWQVYQQHPEHVRVLRDVLRPILASRQAVQLSEED